MPKPAVARLQESIAATRSFAVDAASADQLVRRLETWLDLKSEPDLEALSGRLALGGWHPMSGGPAKVLRDQRRAYLLLCELNGAAANRDAVNRMDLATMKAQASLFIGAYTAPAPTPGFLFGTSLTTYATPADIAKVQEAIVAYRPLVQACVRHLSMAPTSRTERARYERWFGAFDVVRHQTVLGNFQMMSHSPKTVVLYYRGANVPGRASDYLTQVDEAVPPPHGTLKKMVKFRDAGFAFVRPDVLAADPHYSHVFLGEGFFGGQVGRFTVRGVSASGVGVILHEVTHSVCSTDDLRAPMGPGGVMYGYDCCLLSARTRAAEVINNADSYRWYAHECEQG